MPTVLVVDDEAAMRRALRRLFERAGMSVQEAGSAREALEQLDHGMDVDAVVSDYLMPETDGVAFYDRLLTQSPGLRGRVVFLTGAARDPSVHSSIETRGVPLISKLADLQLVLDAVRVALLRKR